MTFTMEEITTKINGLIDEVSQSDLESGELTTGVLAKVTNELGDEAEEFAKLITKKTMSMAAEIADDMGKAAGVPAMVCMSEAHTAAMAHMAVLMLAAGWALKTDQFAAAENLTDEDIESTIASILGGSNE